MLRPSAPWNRGQQQAASADGSVGAADALVWFERESVEHAAQTQTPNVMDIAINAIGVFRCLIAQSPRRILEAHWSNSAYQFCDRKSI
jgi:hypothetical protein